MNPWLLILLALFLSTAAMTLAGWWLGAAMRRGWATAFASSLCSLALSWTWNPPLSERGIVSAWYAVLVFAWHGFPALEIGILSLSFVVPLLAFFAAARFRRRRAAPAGVHATTEPARTRMQIIKRTALPVTALLLVLAFFPQVRQWPGMYAEKTGTVVDSLGKPMAGVPVWVTVYRAIDTFTRRAFLYDELSRVRVVTDEQGHFSVPAAWASMDVHFPLLTSTSTYWTAYPVKLGYALIGDEVGWNFRSGIYPPHRIPSDWFIPEYQWSGTSLELSPFVLEPVEIVHGEPDPAARPRQVGIGQAVYYYSNLIGNDTHSVGSVDDAGDRLVVLEAIGRTLCDASVERNFDWTTQDYLERMVDNPIAYEREIDRVAPYRHPENPYTKRYTGPMLCGALKAGMSSDGCAAWWSAGGERTCLDGDANAPELRLRLTP